MKTWDDWSDFKINKRIADFIFPEQIRSTKAAKKNVVDVLIANGGKGFYRHEYVDYCNNWADIGPIIEQNGISINYDCETQPDNSAEWWNVNGFGDDGEVRVDYKLNPKRSAAIVFLMMNGVKP